MCLFSDDFVRCVCLKHAIGQRDVDEALSSGEAFATVLHRCLVLCFQMFVAYKIHSLPQYAYLLKTPEFAEAGSDSEPEDDDDEYMSDKDEGGDEEGTADGAPASPTSINKQQAADASAAAGSGGAIAGKKSEPTGAAPSGKGGITGEELSGNSDPVDPVETLKAMRLQRNRFYGSKLSFLLVKQQK